MDEEIKDNEWINARQRFYVPPQRRAEPPVDKLISKVVGKTIYASDPRLLSLIVKWKKQANKSDNSSTPDNFLKDPEKIKELRQVLSGDL